MNRLKTSFISHIWSFKSLQQPPIVRRNLAAPTYLALGSNAPSKLPRYPIFLTHLRSFSTDRWRDLRVEGQKMVHEKEEAVNMFKQRMVEAEQSGEYEKRKEAIINRFREEAAEMRANWESKLKMTEDWLLNGVADAELEAKLKSCREAACAEFRKFMLAILEDWVEMEVKIGVVEAEKKGYEKEKEVQALDLRAKEQLASRSSKMISNLKEILGGDSEVFKAIFETMNGTSSVQPGCSLVVDAMALLNGIRQAEKLGASKVIIESGNKILVDCVKGNLDLIPLEIYSIVEEIKSILVSNPQFEVVLHISRMSYEAADRIAHKVLRGGSKGGN